MPKEQREALPDWPALDPEEVARERQRNAEEGNRKLSLACDALRECLQEIEQAEIEVKTKRPVEAWELRKMASEGLDEFTRITGTPRRRSRAVSRSRAAASADPSTMTPDQFKREGYS